MTGTNTLVLCQAEVMAAMEYYLNTVVFKGNQQHSVKNVKYSSTDYTFTVLLEADDQEAKPATQSN